MTTTPAERESANRRKAAERARKEAAGLVRLELFAHPDDHEAIKEHARKLAAARAIRAKRR